MERRRVVPRQRHSMRKKLLLLAFIMCIITGCKTVDNCAAYSQCDEMYMVDYNCEIKQLKLTIPTTYYSRPVPIYNNPRYRYDFYGNRLNSNDYLIRDINGRPSVGNVTRPNAPNVAKRPSIWNGTHHGNGRD